MSSVKLTATITTRWWFHPAMNATCIIAAITRMSDERFEKMVTTVVKHGIITRVM